MRLPIYTRIGQRAAGIRRVTKMRPEPYNGGTAWLGGHTEFSWGVVSRLRARFGALNVIPFDQQDVNKASKKENKINTDPNGIVFGDFAGVDHDALSPCPRVGYIIWQNEYELGHVGIETALRYSSNCDRLIAICGDWSWAQSANDPKLRALRDKLSITHVNIGVSRDLFPQLKYSFNPPGKRGVVYAGSLGWWKGTHKIVEALLGTGIHFYVAGYEWGVGDGEGDRSNFHWLGWVDNADHEKWKWIAERADFFAAACQIDAQPHAVLENVSRGFVPMLTPACNFTPCIPITGVPADDRRIFAYWQEAPETELLDMQHKAIAGLAYYDWDRVVDEIVEVLESVK